VKVGDDVPDALRAASIISTNALVAGMMQLRLQALALGTMPAIVVGTQRYHLLDGTMDIARRRACLDSCKRGESTALGDLHPLPLGVDLDFDVARNEEAKG
jgi:hypothetical protein